MLHGLELIMCPDFWDSWENDIITLKVSMTLETSLANGCEQERNNVLLLTKHQMRNLLVSKRKKVKEYFLGFSLTCLENPMALCIYHS